MIASTLRSTNILISLSLKKISNLLIFKTHHERQIIASEKLASFLLTGLKTADLSVSLLPALNGTKLRMQFRGHTPESSDSDMVP